MHTGKSQIGHLKDHGKLQDKSVNHAATMLSTHTMFGDYLVGDVLFCKRGDK